MATICSNENTMKTSELSMVVIGHVDVGKSSLTGQILYRTNAIDNRKIAKLKDEANKLGKGTFYLAHTMDNNEEEKKRGITIVTNTKQFKTPGKQRLITVIDAPGHRDFINNMIIGAAQCNVALLVVSCVEGEFSAGIASTGQTLEHTLLVNALGVKKIIVAVNKMDHENVNYSQKLYDEKVTELRKQMKKMGGKPENFTFIPISGYDNVNIDKVASDKMPWYKGGCLLDIIDDLPEVSHDLTVPFRMAITNCYKVSGAGEITAGKVYTGTLKVGETVEFAPQEGKAQVKTMERFHKSTDIIYPDDNAGIAFKGKVPAILKPKKGDVIATVGTGLKKVLRFEALVAVVGTIRNEIHEGFKPVVACHTAKVACTLVKFNSIIERKTNKDVIEARRILKPEDSRFVAEFQPERGNLVIECDKKFKILTRFVLRNSKETVGVGQCKKIKNEDYDPNFRVERKGGGKEEKGKKVKKKAK